MAALYIYYLDQLTGEIKGGEECSRYALSRDIDFKDKSAAVVENRPEISNDDIVVLKDGTRTAFVGVCESISSGPPFTLSLLQQESIFDRKIFTALESLISSSGMEAFIVRTINDNFVSSGDALFDKGYITAAAGSSTVIHTTVSSTVDADNGVYNFKTFLGNVRQYYGIGLTFETENGEMDITVKKDTTAPLLVDTRFTDVQGLSETYSIKVLAKLIVKWKNTSTDTETTRTFYLQSNRTITENSASATRVTGTVESMYIEADTEAGMLQEVQNRFSSNSYDHSMSMNILKSSRLYRPEELYVGRKVKIRSERTGIITETMITRKEESSGSDVQKITMGRLPITLIDKIRRL